MCQYLLPLFIILVIIFVLGGQPPLESETEAGEDICCDDMEEWSCQGGASCNSNPKSGNSCCAKNPVIQRQIQLIEKYHRKLCLTAQATDCACIPNLGSKYVGASIASTRDTVLYQHPQGNPASALTNKPQHTIEPGPITLGLNWHFVGVGSLVLKLFLPTQISAVSVIHPPICQIPEGFEKAAPREFQVMGLRSLEDKNPFHFGNFTYDVYKVQSSQIFPVQQCTIERFQLIEFRFTSNTGNPHYTSLYKIQVHGDMKNDGGAVKDDSEEDG